ncbi:alanine dehydrogenase [Streptomyces sp. NPDC051364]|uniref:alanine dehydrogenase n=1 Tax=Streptomyces sp. NPDC051364 TaxID=3155799 RepID=UPI003430EB30
MSQLSLGVIGFSRKEHERRLPIHPSHLQHIESGIRGRMFLERGYGHRLGVPDDRLARQVAGLLPRRELIRRCDVILLPKPMPQDFRQMREGQTLWGCPHFVQNTEVTQLAIDRKLTVIAFEAMWRRPADGSPEQFVFHRTSELAGYCSVQHALQSSGRTKAARDPTLRAAVIGYGSAGRGAIAALHAHGVHDLTIVTRRPSTTAAVPAGTARMAQLHYNAAHPSKSTVTMEKAEVPLAGFLAGHDIVVNCVLQDVTSPQTYLNRNDIERLPRRVLIIDVSCDTAMGFSWVRPTTFARPVIRVGGNADYYAVDHSPSLLWESATRKMSHALLPYLATITDQHAWDTDETISRAIETRGGIIQNQNILLHQGRSPHYPHPATPRPALPQRADTPVTT